MYTANTKIKAGNVMPRSILNTVSGLDMVSGDTELYETLVDSFLEENVNDKAHFASLAENAAQDKGFVSFVHKTKGSAGQIGCEALYDAALALESVLRGKEAGDQAALTREFFKTYDETLSALRQYRKRI